MKLLKRIYCRTYQFIFKIIIPFLPYKTPKLLEEIVDLIDEIKINKIHRLLIVSSKSIIKGSFYNKLIGQLELNNINYTLFNGSIPNPTDIQVEEGRLIYLENNCDGIIAVGGGSAMDLSKAILARIVRPKKDIEKLSGLLKVRKKLPFLVCVPTTAGSGSEVTITSVITNSKTHIKHTINDFCLVPDYALLHYETIINLPEFMTITTGLDALTHAVEAYIGKSRTNETKKAALDAVELIVNNLEDSLNKNNTTAKQNMLKASYYAGVAFRKSYVGYVHAVSHALSGKYNVPHGYANAVILPIMLKEYGESIYKNLGILSKKVFKLSDDISLEEASIYFIDWIIRINNKYNIPTSFDFINEEDISKLAYFSSKEANPLYPVPVLFDEERLKDIIYKLKDRK